MNIRQATGSDAEQLITLIRRVEETASYMMMGPGERQTTVEGQRKQLEQIEEQPNASIFVAEDQGELVAYLFALGGRVERTKHSAYLVIGVHQDYQGRGVGTALFREVEAWAKDSNIKRLDLTAVTENEAGVSLYKKSGFTIEGTKRKTLCINGTYFDEYMMAKIL
ncbi:GNAT family N-acetyltransferase [Alteribacter aurantiacus]|uniref:GNAT family N-acetyltransferase n=1 Tax=Alteribacter aurantiacus TaxID=254410 RepID=UPI00047B329A|nr:GNAT family N-acetyltransferase [Alteribacter aurantiacus]